MATIIRELKLIWPGLLIVNGRARNPQSQGSVERSNGCVMDMLKCWMLDNNTLQWSLGLKFVQMQKNNSLNRSIGMSPYEALFGTPLRVGLASSKLPLELAAKLQSENDLVKLLKSQQIENNVVTFLLFYYFKLFIY